MNFNQKQFQAFALGLVTIVGVVYLAAAGIVNGDAALAVITTIGGGAAGGAVGYQVGRQKEPRNERDRGGGEGFRYDG